MSTAGLRPPSSLTTTTGPVHLGSSARSRSVGLSSRSRYSNVMACFFFHTSLLAISTVTSFIDMSSFTLFIVSWIFYYPHNHLCTYLYVFILVIPNRSMLVKPSGISLNVCSKAKDLYVRFLVIIF